MTLIDDRDLGDWLAACPKPSREVRTVTRPRAGRPAPARPAVAPLHYGGSGIRLSCAPHSAPRGRRPVSTVVTVALAGAAALITLWLGTLAQFSGHRAAAPAALPDRLAVVQVQSGETLQQLAGRVAPQAPAAQIVERIRDLNKLGSAAVDAGQTLIAPIS